MTSDSNYYTSKEEKEKLKINGCKLMHLREEGKLRYIRDKSTYLYVKDNVDQLCLVKVNPKI